VFNTCEIAHFQSTGVPKMLDTTLSSLAVLFLPSQIKFYLLHL